MSRKLCLSIAMVLPMATTAVAGVMQPGQWAIETTIEAAQGPGVPAQLPPQPQRMQACKSQAFVDRENYTSVTFAMQRLQRQQFTCKVDRQEGDNRQARWQFSCERPDGVKVVNRAENQVSADRLEQVATETTTREGQPWSEVRVRVVGRLTGADCAAGDIQLK